MALPNLETFCGDWQLYESRIYQIYLDTVVNGRLTHNGLRVASQFRPETKGKGFGFWHLISEGDTEEDRIPDIRRCERIRWVAWVIANSGTDKSISCWENKRGKNLHVVMWVEANNYVVVLAKRMGYYLIKTAYETTVRRARSLSKERDKFLRG